MPQFIFAYHGGKMAQTVEDQEQSMLAWGAWMESMGNALIQPGAPVGLSKTVKTDGTADHGGANPISGFSVVEADTLEVACDMASGCPLVKDGTGSVEVAEILA